MTTRSADARMICSVRDASETTVVTTDAELSVRLRSGSTDVTAATFVSTPSLGARMEMIAVAPVLLVRMPMPQVTVPLANVAFPRLTLADTKVTPGGNVSDSVAPVTIDGPLFVTVKV